MNPSTIINTTEERDNLLHVSVDEHFTEISTESSDIPDPDSIGGVMDRAFREDPDNFNDKHSHIEFSYPATQYH